MKHKTLETKATITDRGEFTAIAAAYTVDRVKDRIVPGAFKKTIQAWRDSAKRIPLHWDHKADPANIIGSVNPQAMEEVSEGLLVEGTLDLETSEIAREAWRNMKADRVALSFGYLVTKQKRKAGGVTDLEEIDLFEITVTPAPVNPDTRFLKLKGIDESSTDENTDEEPPEAKSRGTDPLKNDIDRELIRMALDQ